MPAHVKRGKPSQTWPRKKVARRKARIKRSDPQSLLFRFLIFVFVILSLGVFWKVFSSWNNRLWDHNSRFTIVVAKENPTLYSFNPQTRKLVLVEVPSETQLETAYGYGLWLAGSLWELGWQESLGGELLSDSLKKTLGVPVDAWIGKEGEELFSVTGTNSLSSLKGAFLSGTIKTNLTFFDRLNLLIRVGGIGLPSRREVNLLSSRVVEETTFPDGVKGYTVVPAQAKAVFEKLFRDDVVFQEAKTLTVVNTTRKSGLASAAARLAAILGVRVISTETREMRVKGCAVKGEAQNISSFSARRLSSLLGCSLEEGETQGAHLELLLGEEFARTF